MKLDIYLYHHRHGVDVIPILRQSHTPPMDEEQLVALFADSIDFELDRDDEYIELSQSDLDVPNQLETTYHIPCIEKYS